MKDGESLLGSSGTPLTFSDTGLSTGWTAVGLGLCMSGSGTTLCVGPFAFLWAHMVSVPFGSSAHTHMTFDMPWKEVFPDTPHPGRKCFRISST